MPATYTSLTISDGTTTADLVDGVNYLLNVNGWAPQETYLRVSRFGGRSQYEDVQEQMSVDVIGATAATVLSNLDTLARLLEQARRWARNESVNAVILSCLPQGSNAGSAYQTVLTGLDSGPMVANPNTWNDYLMVPEIGGVQITSNRSGLWYGATESRTTNTAGSGSNLTATFTSNAVTPSPIKVVMTNVESNNTGFLIIPRANNKLGISNAEVLGITPATNVSDSLAHNSTYVRTSANNLPAVGFFSGGYTPAPSYISGMSRLHVFASCRIVGTATWRLWASDTYSESIRTQGVDVTNTTAKIIFVGTLPITANTGQITLQWTTTSTSSSDRFEIDYEFDCDANANIIALLPRAVSTVAAATTDTLTIDPCALTKPEPSITLGTKGQSYRGNLWMTHQGTAFAAAYLATDASGGWRPNDSGLLWTNAITVSRTQAYLTPQ